MISPAPVERHDALADPAVLIAMNDVQRFRGTAEHVHERALIVELFDGAVHAIEPLASLLRVSVDHE